MLFLNIAESYNSNGEQHNFIKMKEVKVHVGTKLREHNHNELAKIMYTSFIKRRASTVSEIIWTPCMFVELVFTMKCILQT